MKFIIIEVEDPSLFFIEIKEYFYNGKWISYQEENQDAARALEEMQEYCEKSENYLSVQEGKIGQVCAKFDVELNKWLRGRIVSKGYVYRISNRLLILKN
jgi:uncharacterized membrane-anchored protein